MWYSSFNLSRHILRTRCANVTLVHASTTVSLLSRLHANQFHYGIRVFCFSLSLSQDKFISVPLFTTDLINNKENCIRFTFYYITCFLRLKLFRKSMVQNITFHGTRKNL